MILDEFASVPGFPFGRYFESPGDYVQAQLYWLRVLRAAEGFVERDWFPAVAEVDLPDEMYTGRVCHVLNPEAAKLIMIHTLSEAGAAHMLQVENPGLTAKDLAEQRALFGDDFAPEGPAVDGVTREEAEAAARQSLASGGFAAWVEPGVHWLPEPDHPDGGREVAVERLVLTAPISAENESKALLALSLFLRPGSAEDAVNSVFAPDVDGEE